MRARTEQGCTVSTLLVSASTHTVNYASTDTRSAGAHKELRGEMGTRYTQCLRGSLCANVNAPFLALVGTQVVHSVNVHHVVARVGVEGQWRATFVVVVRVRPYRRQEIFSSLKIQP